MSRIVASSTARSSLFKISPLRARSRASSRDWGRRKLPTWSARKGGRIRAVMMSNLLLFEARTFDDASEFGICERTGTSRRNHDMLRALTNNAGPATAPTGEDRMKTSTKRMRRQLLQGLAAAVAAASVPRYVLAADPPLKIGLILPLTGPFASTGRQIEAACRLYIDTNGDTVAGH